MSKGEARRALGPFVGAIALCLAACAATLDGGTPGVPEVPATAVKIAYDLYMAPLGPDEDGCGQFRAFSQRSFVIQVIYYRTDDGQFVPNKALALCRP